MHDYERYINSGIIILLLLLLGEGESGLKSAFNLSGHITDRKLDSVVHTGVGVVT